MLRLTFYSLGTQCLILVSLWPKETLEIVTISVKARLVRTSMRSENNEILKINIGEITHATKK